MIPAFVRGSIAPVFTAFHEDGRLDDDGQRAILDYLDESGEVSACFVRSGMGQMFTFSFEDVKQIAKVSCEHLAGRTPVLVGSAGIWDRDRTKRPDPKVYTKQAVELSQYAESVGASGVVHTIPEAILPGPDETIPDVILRYFEQICDAIKIPVFIYQSPGTDADYCLSPELACRLADMPLIMGMKASTVDAAYIFDITYAVRGKDFGFISGNECGFLAGLVTGSRAVIGQGATMNPRILNAIQIRYEKGDLEGAIAAQHSTNILVQRSLNSTEFFKRYISAKGYPIKPYPRRMGASLYASQKPDLSQADYDAFKALYESELAKY
ncbi:MAG TPA: dihydrodipicolinate synthase family protein [Candidatus Hydrogenedentes bacterium]|nr:dihydrodipicolinate synthase family protein [Candidatus Hydrogenedentota bacterium]HRT20133.1 dihydrodipicolinate synthase family protein [Candidatus Hydrogenedentota bacterium]HRT66680.1 dihydrodipicolinate synthase family protein [Candidatus Hydrogenedentota bacterium]